MKLETQNFWQGIVGTAANVFGTISVSQRDADTKNAMATTQAISGLVKFISILAGVVVVLGFLFGKRK